MKRLLIILTFLFSTLFIVDNVNALEQSDFTDEDLLFSGGYDKFYYNESLDKDNLYIFHTYQSDVTKTVINLNEYPYFLFNKNYGVFYYSSSELYYNTTNDNLYNIDNTKFFRRASGNWNGATDSGKSFLLSDANTSTIYLNFDLNNESGEIFREKNIILSSTPTIDITKETETTVTIDNETFISSVTLNIKFSSIDNNKYLYMYKYGLESEWNTITLTQSNNISKTFSTNDTLYVQILDLNTHELVSSGSYTINSINYDFRPHIDVSETIPTACSFYKNGRNYTICKELNISAKNLEDGNYIASYSYNATDWTNFVNTNISINENKTIYFRIINYLTNEVSYTSTYTVSSIDTDISELGVFNTYSSYYDKDTSLITAYINIYNLLEPIKDNYKIYYSFNSTSFIDITLLLNDMTNFYQFEINNINENKTIYFKITDLNDNILYTSTYKINYQIHANENSNFFTNFKTNFHGLSDIITTPLYAIKKLNKGVCSPLEIPVPYTNKTISLPCMTTIYQDNYPVILNIWQIVTNGIISYYIILDLFKIVKSFKEPEEDKIEVVDL